MDEFIDEIYNQLVVVFTECNDMLVVNNSGGKRRSKKGMGHEKLINSIANFVIKEKNLNYKVHSRYTVNTSENTSQQIDNAIIDMNENIKYDLESKDYIDAPMLQQSICKIKMVSKTHADLVGIVVGMQDSLRENWKDQISETVGIIGVKEEQCVIYNNNGHPSVFPIKRDSKETIYINNLSKDIVVSSLKELTLFLLDIIK
jgi:hypothetical protein